MTYIEKLKEYKEGNRLEAKLAAGGLPDSIWATYSAFANTDGGVILLGVAENDDKSLSFAGLKKNPEDLLVDFWSTINNKNKVNVNILFDRNVQIAEANGKKIIVIEVPRAERSDKPVFLNEKPFAETYRRNGEGDFRCSEKLVKAMIRDGSDSTQDMLTLNKMSFNVFNFDSVQGFRNRMRHTRPGHVWEELEDIQFLHKLGAVGRGESDELHPTAAGLLMFGFEYEIMREYPDYFLDYQESYDATKTWTDRFCSSDGEWSGNVYDFFFKTYNKIILNPKIKIPFKMEGIYRVDDTHIHKAIREALVNCLSNADYYGERGLIVRNKSDELVFENPGGFRISLDEAKSGGTSAPRNSVILKMFNLLDIGERTGSGIPRITESWREEFSAVPEYMVQYNPDRAILTMQLPNEANGTVNEANGTVNEANGTVNEANGTVNEANGTVNEANGTVNTAQILQLLSENPNATYDDIVKNLGLKKRTVAREIKMLRDNGSIKRIGSDKTGYWEVIG